MLSELAVIDKGVPVYPAELAAPRVMLVDTTLFTVFPRASVRP